MMTSRAPYSFAFRGKLAAGSTTSDEPIAKNNPDRLFAVRAVVVIL